MNEWYTNQRASQLQQRAARYLWIIFGVAAVTLAGCIFLLCKQTLNRPSRVLRAVPVIPLSLGIYFVHNILLSVMGHYWFDFVTFKDTVVMTALNFVLSYLIIKTLATVRPLCFAATGMSWRDACASCNWVYTFRRLRGKPEKER